MVSRGRFRERVNAARTGAAQCVEQIQTRGCQFSESTGAIFTEVAVQPSKAMRGHAGARYFRCASMYARSNAFIRD